MGCGTEVVVSLLRRGVSVTWFGCVVFCSVGGNYPILLVEETLSRLLDSFSVCFCLWSWNEPWQYVDDVVQVTE